MNRPTFFYDIECARTFFGVTFIPITVSDAWVEEYIRIDRLKIKIGAEHPDYESYNEMLRKMIKEVGGYRYLLLHNDLSMLPYLINFISRSHIYIGFNSFRYDSLMLDYITITHVKAEKDGFYEPEMCRYTELLKRFSDKVINDEKGFAFGFRAQYPNYVRIFVDYDIRKILHLDQTFTSLKQISILLCWYKVQDFDFEKLDRMFHVPMELVSECMWYNVNDVLITRLLYFNQIEEVKLRENISNVFGVNVRNESRSSTAVKLLKKEYCKKLGISERNFPKDGTSRGRIPFRDVILPQIRFKTKPLQDFLESTRNFVIYVGTTKYSKSIIVHHTKYQLGRGGIHSVDKPTEIHSTNKSKCKDVDVNSWYPFLLTYYRMSPAHLDANTFLSCLTEYMQKRLKAKSNAKKYDMFDHNQIVTFQTEADGLKITINATGGKLGETGGILEDLLAFYRMTVNGQLFLLMLAEAYELNDITVVSANTDGLTCNIPTDKMDKYNEITSAWCRYVGCEVEFADYESYYRRDVNNYIAVKDGFKKLVNEIALYDSVPFLKRIYPKLFNDCDTIEDCWAVAEDKYVKFKGCFLQEVDITKGYRDLIVPLALKRYFLYDIPIGDTILRNRNIYNFCRAQKINRSFELSELEYDPIEEGLVEIGLQKDTRYYVSKTGGLLVKFKKNGEVRKAHAIASKVCVKVFNLYEDKPWSDYDIDYRFYFRACKDIIKQVRFGNHYNQIKFDEL